MDVMLIVIAIIAGIIGLAGVVVPVLPGTLLSYLGMLCIYFVDGATITTTQLVVCGVISVLVILLDYLLPGYFAKLFGGSKYGITGATIGTFVGMFFGLIGIVFGPVIGAIIGEMVGAKSNFDQALKVGFGSFLSFLVGSGIKLMVGLYIIVQLLKSLISIVL